MRHISASDGLVVDALFVRYGPITAVDGISFQALPGSCVALLGPNGAGKSSVLRAISGLIAGTSGAITVRGKRVDGLTPFARARAGVVHVPEGRRVVSPLSVEENLRLAARAVSRRDFSEQENLLEQMYEIFPILGERRSQTSGLLSGGEQQMLAIARGLMASPTVLLLDEPSMGLAPMVIEDIYKFFREFRQGIGREVTMILAEQSTTMALSISDHVHVMTHGRISFSGLPSEVVEADALRGFYLGHPR